MSINLLHHAKFVTQSQHNYQYTCYSSAVEVVHPCKQIDLTSVCATTAALWCQRIIVNHLHNTSIIIIWRLHKSLSRKQIKTELMLYKALFIIHGRVKGILKLILQYKNEEPQLQKWA